jgi:hypothetical protein
MATGEEGVLEGCWDGVKGSALGQDSELAPTGGVSRGAAGDAAVGGGGCGGLLQA